MRIVSGVLCTTLASCLVLLALPHQLTAQAPAITVAALGPVADSLPDAPRPQFSVAAADPAEHATPAAQTQQPAATAPPAQGTSSSQTPATQSGAEKSQHEKAEEQMKEQEQQRVVGVVPTFNVSYRADAVSLTASQKLRLAFRSSIDPVTFAGAFLIAGYHEANDDDTGFGWGIEGYGKRSGAAYLDSFDGTMIGNGILPALLHQDPRYFRLGHGTATHRMLYALMTNVMCKGDKSRKWQPNISNVGGNIISGAISNLYYPSGNSGIGQTFSDGLIQTAEGGFGSIFNEFWPDISRKFLHKDPTHGLDAQARARDAEEKAARKAAQQPQSK